MKLSELKVGMTVTRAQWPSSRRVEVLGIGNKTLFFRDNNGDELLYSDEEGWIIVEPRKKPSERLVEILNEVSPRFDPAPTDILRVVSRYLDEKASEQK